jgi:hypothetical protein
VPFGLRAPGGVGVGPPGAGGPPQRDHDENHVNIPGGPIDITPDTSQMRCGV